MVTKLVSDMRSSKDLDAQLKCIEYIGLINQLRDKLHKGQEWLSTHQDHARYQDMLAKSNELGRDIQRAEFWLSFAYNIEYEGWIDHITISPASVSKDSFYDGYKIDLTGNSGGMLPSEFAYTMLYKILAKYTQESST